VAATTTLAQPGSFILVQNVHNQPVKRRIEEVRSNNQNNVRPNDRRDGQLLPNQNNSEVGPGIVQDAAGRNDDKRIDLDKLKDGRLDKNAAPRKLVAIKGPIVLRPEQTYRANLPGLRITKVVVHSDNLNNYMGFVAGKGDVVKLAEFKKIHLNIDQKKVHTVKGAKPKG
jgi:hypothetical protein